MPRVTQDATRPHRATVTGLSPSTAELSRTFSSHSAYHNVVLLPRRCVATTPVWALPRSLATTGGIIELFSLPLGTKMFQFPRFASVHEHTDNHPSGDWVVPFGNRGIKGHLHLPRAYRSLSRPSSPPRAKASTRRPNLLLPIWIMQQSKNVTTQEPSQRQPCILSFLHSYILTLYHSSYFQL